MFPLAAKTFPKSSEELEEAINDALEEFFALPSDKSGASITGELNSIKTLKINLDDAVVHADQPPPRLKPAGKRQRGPSVQKLNLSAQPIGYEQAKLFLKLNASGLKFDFARDKRGRAMLVLTSAESGSVDAKISKADIEALALQAATLAAEQQGIKVQELDLELTSAGDRAVAANVRVKGKKLLVSGVLHVTGQLDIDDELNATISGLECTGEGLIGSAAAKLVQSKIQSYNGKTIPLMTFSLGDVTLRDVNIDLAKKDLHVTADFGRARA
jgi:hypothetical protein